MADKTIGDLPAASAIYDDDLFLLEQSGEAKNLRGALYKAYLQGFVDAASAASEEAAAALAGVRDAINNIPEGAATPIVNDLTTGGTSMALSAEMGKVLKGELDTKVNPNLLDNWYFANPVNQRGQTEYTSGYTIDRWRFYGSNQKLTIQNDGILLECGAAYAMYLAQHLENALAKSIAGKKVTFSVLSGEKTGTINFSAYVNGAWTTSLVPVANGLVSKTFTVSSAATSFYMEFGGETAGTLKVIAAKLELGTQQTLAHQDANGNWVLNEIPNYAEELAKCQRYQYVINIENNGLKFFGQGAADSAGTSAQIAVPLPCNMRAYPTLTTAGTFLLYGIGKNETAAVSAVTVFRGAQSGQVLVKVASSGLTAGALYQLITNDANARIILDANL